MADFGLRKLASCVLTVVFPLSLFAADSNAAMVYTHGPAWVNGVHIPRPSSAIFSGDLLQTRSDSVANINEPGSSITVLADSLVRFEPSAVTIEHGSVTIATSKGVGTTAGDVKIMPASTAWTEFHVVDVDGTVKISARKGDLTVNDGKETFTLAQGQEASRDESTQDTDQQGKKKRKRGAGVPGATPGATGGILNSPYAIGIGGAAAIGITTWVLVKSDDPASPSKPN